MSLTGYVKRLTRLGPAVCLLLVPILTSCRTEPRLNTESRLTSFCGNPAKIMVLKDKLSDYWVLSGGGAEKLGGKKIRVLADTKVTHGKGEGDPGLIAEALINMWKTQSGSFQSTGSEINHYTTGRHAKVYDCLTANLKETTVIEVAEILAVQDKE